MHSFWGQGDHSCSYLGIPAGQGCNWGIFSVSGLGGDTPPPTPEPQGLLEPWNTGTARTPTPHLALCLGQSLESLNEPLLDKLYCHAGQVPQATSLSPQGAGAPPGPPSCPFRTTHRGWGHNHYLENAPRAVLVKSSQNCRDLILGRGQSRKSQEPLSSCPWPTQSRQSLPWCALTLLPVLFQAPLRGPFPDRGQQRGSGLPGAAVGLWAHPNCNPGQAGAA